MYKLYYCIRECTFCCCLTLKCFLNYFRRHFKSTIKTKSTNKLCLKHFKWFLVRLAQSRLHLPVRNYYLVCKHIEDRQLAHWMILTYVMRGVKAVPAQLHPPFHRYTLVYTLNKSLTLSQRSFLETIRGRCVMSKRFRNNYINRFLLHSRLLAQLSLSPNPTNVCPDVLRGVEVVPQELQIPVHGKQRRL